VYDAYLADQAVIEEIVLSELTAERLGPNEDHFQFVCRKDPGNLVAIDQCASCPFGTECFSISQCDFDDIMRRWMEELSV
jgi:hypothetical protein